MVDTAANSGVRPTASKGLEGVVAASTTLSNVDGANGRLHYRGYAIQDLAEHATFEEVIGLLWDGELPTARQLERIKADLVAQRALPARALRVLRDLSPSIIPIAALRTVVSALAGEDDDALATDPDSLRAKGLALTARMATATAAQVRLRQGLEPVDPDPALGHAANLLYMLSGERPSAVEARAFDIYMVLLAEHSLNASTFTARIAASTGSDLYAVITAALASLQGDAHGGANQRAMEMLREIGSVDNVEPFIEHALETKRRMMGIGHRIYRTLDPRAPILEDQVQRLMDEGGATTWAEIARRLEKVTEQHPYFAERKLSPNVEFFSAPLLDLVGLPTDVFPAAFGCARIVGWVAHMREQLADNRLIRPAAEYIGPAPRSYPPLSARG
jgi:citrate synthase